MTYDLYLGVDPGKKGAWALLKADGTLLAVEPLPYLGDRIDVTGLYNRWQDIDLFPLFSTIGFNLEYPVAVQGQSDGEKKFLNAGILIALASLQRASIHLPRPHQWKSKLNLSKDKSASVRLAVDLWPAWRDKFVGPRGGMLDGMAEAALLSEHLRRATLRIRTPEPSRQLTANSSGRFANGEWVD
jgi:hypothetical protein